MPKKRQLIQHACEDCGETFLCLGSARYCINCRTARRDRALLAYWTKRIAEIEQQNRTPRRLLWGLAAIVGFVFLCIL